MFNYRKSLIVSLLLCLPLAACGEEESSESAEAVTADTPPADTPTEEAPAAEAAEPEVNLDPPAEGGTTNLLSLREGFAANSAAWTGQRVMVRAQFMSATRVGGSLNNVSLVVNAEDYAEDRLGHSMMCAFGDNAPDSIDHTQYAAITVRGTVIERFGRAGLSDCEIVAE